MGHGRGSPFIEVVRGSWVLGTGTQVLATREPDRIGLGEWGMGNGDWDSLTYASMAP